MEIDEGRRGISFYELETIELDDYIDKSENETSEYLKTIADKASDGQLKKFIGIDLHEDPDRGELIKMFVSKNIQTLRKLKEVREITRLLKF